MSDLSKNYRPAGGIGADSEPVPDNVPQGPEIGTQTGPGGVYDLAGIWPQPAAGPVMQGSVAEDTAHIAGQMASAVTNATRPLVAQVDTADPASPEFAAAIGQLADQMVVDIIGE